MHLTRHRVLDKAHITSKRSLRSEEIEEICGIMRSIRNEINSEVRTLISTNTLLVLIKLDG